MYVPQICQELPVARGCGGFGATCIGNFGQSTDLCISSNGRVVSFETADGNGKLTRVTISLKDGKPVSMSWQ
jgi:hypothetical protein